MPRSVNPGDIRVGKGRAPQGTVEDNSLRNPDRDVLPLNAHIHDPSRAHFAVAIAIEDVANNFSSDEVEGALAELAGASSLGRNNGLLAGGTYVLSGASPTTFTLNATTVLLNGTDADLTGTAINLTDGATNFVYVDPGTGNLAVATGAPPAFSGEPVLLARIVISGGGAVTAQTDARWFVLNVDRKPALTVRSTGVAADRNAEANFESLEAALLYLEEYASAGASEIETHRILIRGNLTVNATYVLPALDGIIFEGDGEAQITSGSAFAGSFFNVNSGNVQFKNIVFVCDHAGLTGIDGDGWDTVIENCDFLENSNKFDDAISLGNASRCVVRNCRVIASNRGIRINNGNANRVEDCLVFGDLGIGQYGIAFYDVAGPAGPLDGNNIVRGCTVSGFGTAIFMRGNNNAARDCVLTDCGIGIEHQLAGGGGDGNFTADNVTVTLDTTTGTNGIQLDSIPNSRISNCRLKNERTIWVAEDPRGIDADSGCTNLVVSGCEITGFYNPSNGRGQGIECNADTCLYENNVIDIGDVGTTNPSLTFGINTVGAEDCILSNNIIRNVSVGIQANGDRAHLEGNSVTLSADTGRLGFNVGGDNSTVANNLIVNPRLETAYTTEFIVGIYANGIRMMIESNQINGFYNQPDNSGRGIYVTGVGQNTHVANNIISQVHTGIECTEFRCKFVNNQVQTATDGLVLTSAANNCTVIGGTYFLDATRGNDGINSDGQTVLIEGARIEDAVRGVVLGSGSTGSKVSGCVITNNATAAAAGIQVTDASSWTIENNTLIGNLVASFGVSVISSGTAVRDWTINGNLINGFDSGAGIQVLDECTDGVISGNQINNTLGNNVQVTSEGIRLAATTAVIRWVTIDNNEILNCTRGVVLEGTAGNNVIGATVAGNIIHHCAADVSPGGVVDAATDFAAAGGLGIGAIYAEELVISDNQITEIGRMWNTNATFHAPAGPDYSAQAIYCLLTERMTVSGNNIVSTRPGGTGVGRGIAVRQRWATGTRTGRIFNVTNNTIDDEGSVMDAMILVEVSEDGAVGVQNLDSVVIDDNNIRNGTNAIYALIGVNSRTDGLAISNNTVSQPSANGILVVAGDDTTTLNGFSALGNTIYDTGGAGIFLSVLLGGTVSGTAINNNSIAGSVGNAISVLNVVDGTILDTQVNENNLVTPGVNGIAFGVAQGELTNVQVNGNMIDAPGVVGGAASQGIGITFLAGNGPMTQVTINDNTIDNAGTNGLALGGFEIVIQATSTVDMEPGSIPIVGDTVTIGGNPLVAILNGSVPGVGQWELGNNEADCATNFANAVNDSVVNPAIAALVSAQVNGTVVTLTAIAVGSAGNGITVTESTGGVRMSTSGATAGGVGGASDASTMNRWMVCRNMITTPGEAGMIALTYDGAIQQWTVNDNIIHRPGSTGGSSSVRGAGILFGAVEDASAVSFNRIIMTGNRMSWAGSDTGANNSHGIGFLVTEANVDEILISDCQIDEVPGSGIFLGTVATAQGRLTNIDISDCNIKSQASAANSATFPTYGIVMLAAASDPGGPHQSISVQGCKLRTSSDLVTAAGISILAFPFGGANSGKLSSIHLTDNQIESSFNGILFGTFPGSGAAWVGTRAVIESVTITNNIIRDIDALAIASLMTAAAVGTGDADFRVENVDISGNQMFDCATNSSTNVVIGLDFPIPTMNLKINRNSLMECGNVNDPGGDILSLTPAISVQCGEGSGSQQGLQGVSICDNDIRDQTGGGIFVQHSLFHTDPTRFQNIEVSRNRLRNMSEYGIGLALLNASGAMNNISACDNEVVDVDGDYTGTLTGYGVAGNFQGMVAENVDFCRNKVRTLVAGGVGIIAQVGGGLKNAHVDDNSAVATGSSGIGSAISALAAGEVDNLSVSGNNVFDSDGIAGVDLFLTLATTLRGVRVNNNSIQDTRTGTDGISFLGPSTGNTRNVTVANNTVTNSLGGAFTGSDGILIDFSDFVAGLVVTGNTVSFSAFEGIEVQLEQTWGCNVSNNMVEQNQSGTGIFVNTTGNTRNMNVNGNGVHQPAGNSLSVVTSAAISALSINGNSCYSGVHGIIMDSGASDCSGVSICGNTIDIMTEQGISVTPGTGGINALAISGNSVQGTEYTAIYVNGTTGAMENISITGNTVHNWNTDTNTAGAVAPFRSGISVGCTNAPIRGVIIQGNALDTVYNGAVAFSIVQSIGTAGTDMWNIVIQANSVLMDPNDATTVLFQVDTVFANDQRIWSINGNAVRGPNVFWSTSGAWAGDIATVRNNVGQAGSGGGAYVTGLWPSVVSGFGANTNGTPNEDGP